MSAPGGWASFRRLEPLGRVAGWSRRASSAIREFTAPVTDTDAPMLRDSLWRAARNLCVFLAVMRPLCTAADFATQELLARNTLVHNLAFASGEWAGLLALQTRWGRRYPEWVLFGVSFALSVDIAVVGWSTHSGSHPLQPLIPAILVVVSNFVPWRPKWSLLLGTSIIAVTVPLVARFSSLPTEQVLAIVQMTVTLTVTAAVTSQAHRRLWRRLEQARTRLTALDRMASVGWMTAGLAHELKTPISATQNDLAVAHGLVEELGRSVGHPQVTEADLREIVAELGAALGGARHGAERTASFVRMVREHTQGLNDAGRTGFSVAERVRGVMALLDHRVRKSGVVVDTAAVDEGASLRGVPRKFDQILLNLLGNALDSCAGGAGTSIRLSARDEGRGVRVTVEDDGPGVPPGLRERIFQPLFTTRADGQGTGIGLTISRDLAEGDFGGSLVLAESAAGACFELWCPHGTATSPEMPVWVPGRAA